MTSTITQGGKKSFLTCLSMFLLLLAGSVTAQTVYIPDPNFKAALLAHEDLNTNGDDEIQVSEAAAYDGQIKVSGESITDLTGIAAFTSLTDLRVHYNSLSTVDLSANLALKQLHIQHNQLTMLDLSANTALDMLRVQDNHLTELDLRHNTSLRYLEVTNNELESLNVQNGNHTAMYKFEAGGNPALGCIQVDDATYADSYWADYADAGVAFSTDCGYAEEPVVYIPDANFKAALLADAAINTNGDDEIQVSEAESTTVMDISGENITDLTGLAAFTSLMYLYVNDNALTTLDVSQHQLLTELNARNNQLSELDFHYNLDILKASSNALASLDLSDRPVNFLDVSDNQLTALNLQTGTVIEYIYATGNPELTCILVDDDFIEDGLTREVDEGVVFSTDCDAVDPVVHIPDPNFKAALLADTNININNDDEIQVFEAAAYGGQINVSGESITDLSGIAAFTSLTDLRVHYNGLSTVDLSANLALKQLHIQHNQLTSLDLSANTALDMLRVQNNLLTELDLSNNTSLRYLEVTNNELESLNVQNGNNMAMYKFEAGGNPDLECVQVDDATYADSHWADHADAGVTFSTDCGYEEEPVVYIPDANFKAALLADAAINTNGDDEIQVSETEGITAIDVSGAGIFDATGVAAFEELLQLDLNSNYLTAFDASALGLDYLGVSNNHLMSLDLGGIIEYLDADNNAGLSCIQTSNPGYYENNEANVQVDEGVIFSVDCASEEPVVYIPDANFKAALLAMPHINTNGDDEIQVSETGGVDDINVSGKNISDLTGIKAFQDLWYLHVDDNNLTSLDLDGMVLEQLYCDNNNLRTLRATVIYAITCANNNLNFLDIKSVYNLDMYDFNATGNPNLKYVEVNNPVYFDLYLSDQIDPGAQYTTQATQAEVEIVLFYDRVFKEMLVDDPTINTNGDHEIQVTEANSYSGVLDISNSNIDNVRGIETFTAITGFIADNNRLTAVDLSASTELQTVSIDNNDLKYLSIKNGNNATITSFSATGNEELSCVEVDDPAHWSGGVDPGTSFSADCGQMNVHIPDLVFLDRAVLHNAGLDKNSDGWVQGHEAAAYSGMLNVATGYYDDQIDMNMDLRGVEAFTELTGLQASFLGMDSLNVSANTKLTYLDLLVNDLTVLNVQNGNNENFTYFDATYNDYLTCIEVDDVAYAEANWSDGVGAGVSFSLNCGYNEAPVVYLPDANFKAALLADAAINTNGDDEIQVTEAEAVTGQIQAAGQGITDLTGIEAFIYLTDLRVHYNNLASVDLSENVYLEQLHIQHNHLTSVDLSTHQMLDMVRAQNNDLTSLDVSANTALRYLEVSNNALTELNVKNGNNENMYRFLAQGNPDLACIAVDDAAYAGDEWSAYVDAGVSFSEDCSGASSRLAVGGLESSLEVSIFPNPSAELMRVSANEKLDAMYLYSATGAEMNVRFANGEADIRHLKKGIYFLKVFKGDEVSTVRFVKR